MRMNVVFVNVGANNKSVFPLGQRHSEVIADFVCQFRCDLPRLDGSQVDLVGVSPAAPLFPDQVQLLQRAEGRRHLLLTDPQFPGQLLPGEDDEHLPEVIHPAISPGKLEAVQQEGVRTLASRPMPA